MRIINYLLVVAFFFMHTTHTYAASAAAAASTAAHSELRFSEIIINGTEQKIRYPLPITASIIKYADLFGLNFSVLGENDEGLESFKVESLPTSSDITHPPDLVKKVWELLIKVSEEKYASLPIRIDVSNTDNTETISYALPPSCAHSLDIKLPASMRVLHDLNKKRDIPPVDNPNPVDIESIGEDSESETDSSGGAGASGSGADSCDYDTGNPIETEPEPFVDADRTNPSEAPHRRIQGDFYIAETLFSCCAQPNTEEIELALELFEQHERGSTLFLAHEIGVTSEIKENIVISFIKREARNNFKGFKQFYNAPDELKNLLFSTACKIPRFRRNRERLESFIDTAYQEARDAATEAERVRVRAIARAAEMSISELRRLNPENVKVARDTRRNVWFLKIEGGTLQNLDGIADIPDIDMIEELDLSLHRVKHLEAGAIDACVSLKYFKGGMRIETIESKFFSRYHVFLEYIDLSLNMHLTSLPDDIFSPSLPSLETINLTNTKIRYIPPLGAQVRHLFLNATPIGNDCFKDAGTTLTNLHVLSMQFCQNLTEIPPNLLRYQQNLRALLLKRSNIRTVPNSIERQMPHLLFITLNKEAYESNSSYFRDFTESPGTRNTVFYKPVIHESDSLCRSLLDSMARNRFGAGVIDARVRNAAIRNEPIENEEFPEYVPREAYETVIARWDEMPFVPTDYEVAVGDLVRPDLVSRESARDQLPEELVRLMTRQEEIESGTVVLDSTVTDPGNRAVMYGGGAAAVGCLGGTVALCLAKNVSSPVKAAGSAAFFLAGAFGAAKSYAAMPTYSDEEERKQQELNRLEEQISREMARTNARLREEAYRAMAQNRQEARRTTEENRTRAAQANQAERELVRAENQRRRAEAETTARKATEENRARALASAQETVQTRNDSRRCDLNVLKTTCDMLKYVTLYTGVVCTLITIDKNPHLSDHELEILVNRFFPESSIGDFTDRVSLIEQLRRLIAAGRAFNETLRDFREINDEHYARIFDIPQEIFARYRIEIVESMQKALSVTNIFREYVTVHSPGEISRMLRKNVDYTRKNGTQTSLPFAYALVQTLNEFCETFINPLYDVTRRAVRDMSDPTDHRRIILTKHLIALHDAHDKISTELLASGIGRGLFNSGELNECYVNGRA